MVPGHPTFIGTALAHFMRHNLRLSDAFLGGFGLRQSAGKVKFKTFRDYGSTVCVRSPFGG